jgi:hypothetical protein
MRAAEARSKCETWPWPSGPVAGMPSLYRRRPRTPKLARAPKAARADLQVLGIVAAVVGDQPGHALQCLAGVEHRAGAAQGVAVDDGDRVGRLLDPALDRRAGDHDGLLGRGAGRGERTGSGQGMAYDVCIHDMHHTALLRDCLVGKNPGRRIGRCRACRGVKFIVAPPKSLEDPRR